MNDRKPWMRFGGAAGLVASGLVAGGVLTGTLTATAAEGTTAPESSMIQRAGEEMLTGDTKTQVEAAVLAEYPDATIERTETDSDGVYESHTVTADGERLTVLVDEDFTVTGTEAGGRGPGRDGECSEDGASTTPEDPGVTETPTTESHTTEAPGAS